MVRGRHCPGAAARPRRHGPGQPRQGDLRRFSALQPAEFLFCENETNTRRLYGTEPKGFVKDGINDFVVSGDRSAVNPKGTGTKCAAATLLQVPGGGTATLRFRFAPAAAGPLDVAGFEAVFTQRIAEADAFYGVLQARIDDPDARAVQRQALAGMLWSKQLYRFNVRRWLNGDPTQPPPPRERRHGRDSDWGISTMPTSSRCRTSGNIPGTPPGTSRSTA